MHQLMSSFYLVGLFILEVALLRMLFVHHTRTSLSKIVKDQNIVLNHNLQTHKDLNLVKNSVASQGHSKKID